MTIVITRSSVLEPEQKLSELDVGSALDTDTVVIVRDGTVPDFRAPVSTIRTGLPGPPGPQGPPVSVAPLILPAISAPVSPVDGYMWYDGADLNFRIGGVTRKVVFG